ncbi:MAG: tautomerase family protein [Desulfovibrio sp.]|nr:tautomerase family protein [Desulfovibrio sp.]MBI4960914.1 tautomerase family protein [Desulfovibrio sp.]
MPLVRVSVVRQWSAEEKLGIMNGVHAALVEAFGIPEPDRNIRFQQFDPSDWLLPPGKSDRYVLVEVFAFQGRSAQAKGALYASVVENLSAFKIPAGDIFIIVVEQPRENWGIRGGQRADLVDLGYEVKV